MNANANSTNGWDDANSMEVNPPITCHVITLNPHRRHSNMIQYIRTDFINGKPDGCQTHCLIQRKPNYPTVALLSSRSSRYNIHTSHYNAHCGVQIYMQCIPSHCELHYWPHSASSGAFHPVCPSLTLHQVLEESETLQIRCRWWVNSMNRARFVRCTLLWDVSNGGRHRNIVSWTFSHTYFYK